MFSCFTANPVPGIYELITRSQTPERNWRTWREGGRNSGKKIILLFTKATQLMTGDIWAVLLYISVCKQTRGARSNLHRGNFSRNRNRHGFHRSRSRVSKAVVFWRVTHNDVDLWSEIPFLLYSVSFGESLRFSADHVAPRRCTLTHRWFEAVQPPQE